VPTDAKFNLNFSFNNKGTHKLKDIYSIDIVDTSNTVPSGSPTPMFTIADWSNANANANANINANINANANVNCSNKETSKLPLLHGSSASAEKKQEAKVRLQEPKNSSKS